MFEEVFSDLSPAWISFRAAIIATIITFFLGTLAARLMFGYHGKGKGLIDGILTAPLVLPPTVVGFLLLVLFGRYGPLGKLLATVNFSVIFTWYATVIAATVVAFPLMYKTALGAFKQIDSSLLACARTLGASELTIFLRVMLPLAKPGLFSGTMLAFARSLGEFGATLMLAGSIPGRTQTIPVAIFFAAEGGRMDEAFAWVIVILLISLGIITAVNWSEEASSGRKVKGKQLKHRSLNSRSNSLPSSNETSQPQLIVNIQKKLQNFVLDVSFSTDEKPLGLLGGSGAGKSFILRCIAGLETPDRGQIILNGRVLYDSERKINLPSCERNIGYLFQNYALFPHLTIAENIAFGLPKGLSSRMIKQRVEQQLVSVQLGGMGDRYPRELSGGQQQRVALARALASEPEALLLDEPLSALDTHLRDQLEKLLTSTIDEHEGVTLFVTHNLEEAYRVCENLLVIDGGKIIAEGNKQDIFEHPSVVRVAELTGCKNFSPAIAANKPQSQSQIEALDWGCILQTVEPIPETLSHIGFRAHQFSFPEDKNHPNTFPCWLAMTSETQHRMTLYLKLHQPPNSPTDYHLQAEVFKEKWAKLKERPFPWFVHLAPERLILLRPTTQQFYSLETQENNSKMMEIQS
ncbi:molybdate ABC transporter permease subunit [Capilliphycus salinus ALCB114379]|uniref:molybdate ABC transporter permease subunit n=1 Tax=Capilliphycus salinus TaxID=2768948 RepID=UPI0039A495E0